MTLAIELFRQLEYSFGTGPDTEGAALTAFYIYYRLSFCQNEPSSMSSFLRGFFLTILRQKIKCKGCNEMCGT